MNFYKSDIILNQETITHLKEFIENSDKGCTLFESTYLNTHDSLEDPYFKDFIGGLNNDSPLVFLLFKMDFSDAFFHKFPESPDFILSLVSDFSKNLFIFNSKINTEKKDISLEIGKLSHIYFYEKEALEENRNADISIYHEDKDNECRVLLSLPRLTVYDNSNWNTIVNYDFNILYKIIIKRIQGIVCLDSQTI